MPNHIKEEGWPSAISGQGSSPVPSTLSQVREGGPSQGGLGGALEGRGLVGEQFSPLDPSLRGRSENQAFGLFPREVQPAPAGLGEGFLDHSQGGHGSSQIQDQRMAALVLQSTPIAGESKLFLIISNAYN